MNDTRDLIFDVLLRLINVRRLARGAMATSERARSRAGYNANYNSIWLNAGRLLGHTSAAKRLAREHDGGAVVIVPNNDWRQFWAIKGAEVFTYNEVISNKLHASTSPKRLVIVDGAVAVKDDPAFLNALWQHEAYMFVFLQ